MQLPPEQTDGHVADTTGWPLLLQVTTFLPLQRLSPGRQEPVHLPPEQTKGHVADTTHWPLRQMVTTLPEHRVLPLVHRAKGT